MKKLVPYVNLETVKDSNGKITQFVVRTVSYLPKDSKLPESPITEGPLADDIQYRTLEIPCNGTSEEFDYFGLDFIISRSDVGLLERGVKVFVKRLLASQIKTSSISDPEEKGGISIDFEGADV